MVDAEAEAEAAFIKSMQNANQVAGSYGASGPASEQQKTTSDDEYDPAQAVQSSDANQSVSLDSSKHALYPSVSSHTITPSSDPAIQSLHDVSASKAESQSRSMSRASSSTIDSRPGHNISDDNNGRPAGNAKLTVVAAVSDTDNAPNASLTFTAPESRTVSNASLNHLPAKPVSIPVDKQDQIFSPVLNDKSVSVSNSSDNVPDAGASHNASSTRSTQRYPTLQVQQPKTPLNEQNITPTTTASRVRLPHDKIGILEDRIKEDPQGDLEAWLNLISEHRRRGKIEDARNAYERLLSVFPFAAEQWVAYAHMENEAHNRNALEKIFHKSLLQIPNIQLWSMYLDHIRRHNNTTTDTSGAARQTIHQAYELALQHVGLDKDSGKLWQDYLQFIKSGPGIVGGNNWQDQQKMDLLRKTYQRAICVPTQSANLFWKEYDIFEIGLNKMTGRKFLQEHSPSYMTARSAHVELQNITRKLRRTTLPILPPAPGFEGDIEYMEQLEIWKRWIQWEKDDPLVLKQENIAAYRDRIVFTYKQALMAMRFWPELWCDAADFCFLNDLEIEGNDFLSQGISANPESCLLAFKRADRLELTLAHEEGEESAKRRGIAVREPYDKVLDALYDLIGKAKDREGQEIERVETQFNIDEIEQRNGFKPDDRDDDINDETAESSEERKTAQVDAVKNAYATQIRSLSKTISFVWIALMRAMRRIQGKGKVNEQIGGSRQIFTDARKRGRITSDVYVASALIEFHCYDPETTKKIFERGLKLFPDDEAFALEYIKHLIANNDHTNARVVFETAVGKLASKPETLPKAKPLYVFIHDFESRYGELAQIMKLEKRMRDLFPDDPQLALFSRRFTTQGFDPTVIRPIISPNTQTKPKHPSSTQRIPSATEPAASNPLQSMNSPKRPLAFDDSDTDGGRPRKLVRGESPLKGAAGRRLDQQKRNQHPHETPQINGHIPVAIAPPPALPRDILFLLGIIPKAETYHATKFSPEGIVRLLRDTAIPTTAEQLRGPPTPLGAPTIPVPPQGPAPMSQMAPGQSRPMSQIPPMHTSSHMQSMHPMSQPLPSMPVQPYSLAAPGQYHGGSPAVPLPQPVAYAPALQGRHFLDRG